MNLAILFVYPIGMQKALCKPGPDLVICDEGHRIKNHQSNIHQALHQIQTRFASFVLTSLATSLPLIIIPG